MKSPLLLCAALAVTAFTPLLTAQDGPTPFPKADDAASWPGKGPIRTFGWMVDNRNYFWKQREHDTGAVVFCGDSLTAGWKKLGEEFPELRVANRGIGGDVSRGLLFRFQEDVLDLKPRAIVILIGANDLSAHADVNGIESNIKDMIKMARESDPQVPIVVCTTPPRETKEAPTKPGATEAVNALIKGLEGTDPHLAVFDLYAALATPDGGIITECFAKDGVHLAGPGYDKWGEGLKPVLEKLGVK
jgi:lysophospholipase L1-like esterase